MSTPSKPTTSDLAAVIADWPGQAVVVRHDRPTGTWVFIALHDATLGQPTGGTRIKIYPTPADGLRDALRLAEGMTYKWAALSFDRGGGKAVLAIPRELSGDERSGLLHRYGLLVESLSGAFATGEDLGTTPDDMAFISRYTRWIAGSDREQGTAEDPGPFTAHGVLRGIEAGLRHVFGSPSLDGRSVLIQGVGDVGEQLARGLAAAGARLLLSDLDTVRVKRLAIELGAEVVPPDEVMTSACDVFAPCAIGGVLDSVSIPQLACRIVAGSANNQLAEEGDAERLHQRGILYAPDYVINGGGALAFGLIVRGERDHGVLTARVGEIGEALSEIFAEAAERGESPLHAARRRVERVLAAKREAAEGVEVTAS